MKPISAQALVRIADRCRQLRVAVVGDFCLDQYLEIDPDHVESSIETDRPVHNVLKVRSQPGAAGTIASNLAALGVGRIDAIGFCGEDGEGFELTRALRREQAVNLDRFLQTPERHTFVYRKPLVMHKDRPPEELSRFDRKNLTPTPAPLAEQMAAALREIADDLDAVVLMDQVDRPGTGVVTEPIRQAAHEAAVRPNGPVVLADSRSGLGAYPPMGFKMNLSEFESMTGESFGGDPQKIRARVASMASENRQPVFVTLAERGIVGADATGASAHVPAHPVRGAIDVVGAGDSVLANLTAALSAGAALGEAMQIAMAAASHVVHQMGTTGTADWQEVAEKLKFP